MTKAPQEPVPDAPPALGHDVHRVLGELAMSAAGIGTFDWDLTTGRLDWDDRLVELFGYDRATFRETIDAFDERVHPDDLPRVHHLLQTAIDTCGGYEAEYRILLPDGRTRWVAARGRTLCDEDGRAARVLGAAFDTTARQDGEARLTRVLEAMRTAFFSLDPQWRFTYVNAEAERVLGRDRDELLGGVVWDLFPAAVGSVFERTYRGAAESGEPVSFEAWYPEPLNSWFEVRAWPGPDGLSVYFLDITGRREAQDAAEQAARRASLVADVTTELTGTLDAEEAVARLAQLVVPAVADWCVVTLVHDDEQPGGRRGLQDVGWWHHDPTLRPLVERYSRTRLDALTDGSFVMQALESGETVTVASGAAAAVARLLRPGEAQDIFRRLAPEAVAVLPLRGRGRTVGLLTLFNSPERGAIGVDELATAHEVAGRAGLALDNSRLYRQQRQVAETLQRSLLTAPPEPDHAQVVVRYEPAAEAAQIGGDWYDAFLQRDGATVLVIGDVVGHDIAAAATMGQLRSILRGIAVATGAGPADVLSQVDRALRTLQADTIATAVVARIEQTDDERRRGITHVRWSNAGHPPPMVINPDGTVAVLSGARADLLLGVAPETRRVESTITVDRGATLLLYSDGLVERRGQGLKAGLARLRDTLEEVAHLGLDDLCDTVLSRMLPDRPEDDVALVAVRLHRQDRPRPREAGPNDIPDDVPPAPDVDPDAG